MSVIKSNTVKVKSANNQDIEIYLSKLDILVDEYIASLPDPETIYNTMCFSGLLLYIYQHLIKYIIPDSFYNDYPLLDRIFNEIYLPLCYKFNKNPTIIQFSSELVKISNSNLSDVAKGYYRTDGSRVNPESRQIVKKWYSVCESGLASRAGNDNSIGSMFILKSKYSWNDQPKQTIEVIGNSPEKTIDELAEQYKTSELPPPPDLTGLDDE